MRTIAERVFEKIRRRAVEAYDEARTRFSFRHLSGPKSLELQPDDVVLVCLIKNGAFWLDTFMQHYTQLGISHFVFVDNGSTDNTVDYLRAKEKVTVVQSELPAKRYESILRRQAIRKFANGHWCLCVDSDELFDYHHSDKLPLKGLIGYLDREGYTCLVAQLLDMFPEGPIGAGADSADYATEYSFYDLSGIHTHTYHNCAHSGYYHFARDNTVGSPKIRWFFGGIRTIHFHTDVTLTKHSLIRVSAAMIPSVHPHCSSGVKCADISALIRHFKFAGDFRSRVRSEVDNKTWETEEPGKYLRGLNNNNKLILKLDSSRRFSGTGPLVTEGFLVTSDKFERWVEHYKGSPS